MAEKRPRAAQSSTTSSTQRKRQKRDIRTGRFVSDVQGESIKIRAEINTKRPTIAKAAPTNHRATLLGLPRELRSEIYAHLQSDDKTYKYQLFQFPEPRWYAHTCIWCMPKNFNPIFALVNKKINHEYNEEFRRNLKVIMGKKPDRDGIPPSRGPFSLLAPLLRDIQRCTLRYIGYAGWWDHPERELCSVTAVLSKVTAYMKNLKDLIITIAVLSRRPLLDPLQLPHKRSNLLSFLRFRPRDLASPLRHRRLNRLEKAIEMKPGPDAFWRVEEFADGERRVRITDWVRPGFAEALTRLRWKIAPAHQTHLPLREGSPRYDSSKEAR